MNLSARDWFVLALMPLLFATNVTIGRAAVEAVPPWTLAFMRWSLASLILLPFAARDLTLMRGAVAAQWPRFVLLGFLGMWLCGGVVYVSLQITTATHAALIYTSSPVIVVVLAAIIARKPLPLAQILGVALAATGVALTASGGNLAHLLDLDFNRGDVGIFICAISWAIYSLVLKHRGIEAIPTIVSFFLIAASGVVMLAPCMLYEIATIGWFPMTAKAWGSIAGIVIFASILSFWSYQYGVRIVGPSLTSVFMYLSPAYGIALAVVFLGEPVRLYHGIGLALILAGVGLATGVYRLIAGPRKAAP